jgi:hypothetical protein
MKSLLVRKKIFHEVKRLLMSMWVPALVSFKTTLWACFGEFFPARAVLRVNMHIPVLLAYVRST